MILPIRPARLVPGLALILACSALAAGSQAQDRFDPPGRYGEDDRYAPDRRYDGPDRYDERDRYEERDRTDERRYDDRYAGRGGPADDADDPARSFEELDRHGEWRNHPRYGRVWIPDVDDDWRPYTRGHWVNTEEHGWYWQSEEPFGWATFHYGRWFFDEEEGSWVWVPGNVWGPAWVAWREGEEEMGWAPLPPEAHWYPDRGLVLASDFYTSPRYASFWIFASPRYMCAPGLHRHVAPRSRATYFFARTAPRHNHYRWTDRRIYNGGISVARVERFGGRPVPTMRINVVSSFRDQGLRGGNRQVLNVYRPQRVENARPERWRTNFTRPEAAAPRRFDGARQGAGGSAGSPRFDGRPDRDRGEAWRNRDRERDAATQRGTVRVPDATASTPPPGASGPVAREPRRDWFNRDRDRDAAAGRGSARAPETTAPMPKPDASTPVAREPRRDWINRDRDRDAPPGRARESDPAARFGNRPPQAESAGRGEGPRGGDAARRDVRPPQPDAAARGAVRDGARGGGDGRPSRGEAGGPAARQQAQPGPKQPSKHEQRRDQPPAGNPPKG